MSVSNPSVGTLPYQNLLSQNTTGQQTTSGGWGMVVGNPYYPPIYPAPYSQAALLAQQYGVPAHIVQAILQTAQQQINAQQAQYNAYPAAPPYWYPWSEPEPETPVVAEKDPVPVWDVIWNERDKESAA